MKATTKAEKIKAWAITILMTLVSLAWAMPIVIVAFNSFKDKASIATETFRLPNAETFVGFMNFTNGITSGNYNFWMCVLYSVVITVLSVSLILICTSMAAWYITRVNSGFAKLVYALCTFSMIVPFQMVQYSLSNTANMLHLDTPWTIPVVYLGFGAGMAIFMFTGFIKQIPLEIEEAAVVDGCSPLVTFFKVVLPILSPSMISVGILEAMWVWNDYLLPSLVLDITKYRTIPIHIQYLRGSYGAVDMGASMALIIMALLPVIIIYLFCQKYIIKGVAAGAVKG